MADESKAAETDGDFRAFLMKKLAAALPASKQKAFPTNGCLSHLKAQDYYIIEPLSTPQTIAEMMVARQWCTLVGPRQQGKTTTITHLVDVLRDGGAYACASTMTPQLVREAESGRSLLHSLLQGAVGSNAQSEWPTPDALRAWLTARINSNLPTSLFLDEFDVLGEASSELQNEFLAELRALKLSNGSVVVVGVGNTLSMRLAGLKGSPFNTTVTVLAPPFSAEDVAKLLHMAVKDDQLDSSQAAAAVNVIFSFCNGHRGMVCYFAEAMRRHAESHGVKSKFDLEAYKEKMVLEIMAKPVTTHLRRALLVMDKETGDAALVSSVIAAVVTEEVVQRPSEPSDRTVRDTIDAMADCGFLMTADNVKFTVTSPLYRAILRKVLVGRFDKRLELLTTEEEGALDVSQTLINCVSRISVSSFSASSRLCTKQRGCPKEALYVLELAVVLKSLQRQRTGLVVIPEATVVVPGGPTMSIDFVLRHESANYVVEVVAHERTGPTTRMGSVAEHYNRVATHYAAAAAMGDESAGEDEEESKEALTRCWLVDFNTWGRRNNHPARVAEHIDLASGSVPAVNVLFIFHTANWDRIAYVRFAASVELGENFCAPNVVRTPP